MKLRCMSSVFVFCRGKVLLLYRVGSRVLKEPQWVGPGGHLEPEELNDPAACIRREWQEETGFSADVLQNLHLRYIAMRSTGQEVRHNYYFTADWPDAPETLSPGKEGNFAWFLPGEVPHLPMPFTAGSCLLHLLEGKADAKSVYVATPILQDEKLFMRFSPLAEY